LKGLQVWFFNWFKIKKLIEGIRFDVPYTMVPETGLLSQSCDPFSGIVERDKRQYWLGITYDLILNHDQL
jgi:hypothetical protein